MIQHWIISLAESNKSGVRNIFLTFDRQNIQVEMRFSFEIFFIKMTMYMLISIDGKML